MPDPTQSGPAERLSAPADVAPRRRNVLVRAWDGEVPAWKLFWLVFLPLWLLLAVLCSYYGFIIAVLLWLMAPWFVTPIALVLLFAALAAPVLLWRCSFNVTRRPLGYAARVCAGLLIAAVTVAAVGKYERINERMAGSASPGQPTLPPLLDAAQKGDVGAVRTLLAQGADVNLRDPARQNRGRTALHYAAGGTHYATVGRHSEVAKLLLAHGADVNAKADGGYTPLHVAAGLGQVDMVRWLLDNGANINAEDVRGRPLRAAVAEGHEAVVALLLERKADLSGILSTYGEIGTYLPSHTPILRRLVDAGADVNGVDDRGRTSLDFLSRRGEEPLLFVLSRGAKLSAGDARVFNRLADFVDQGYTRVLGVVLKQGYDLRTRGPHGLSLMHSAARVGAAMPAYLHARGVPPDEADNYGERPIHVAVQSGKADVVAWLLKAGVSPDSPGRDAMTPLMMARFDQADQIVKLLVDAGADIHRRDRNGLSALDHAAMRPQEGVERLLRHGARVDSADAAGYTALHRVRYAQAAEALLAANANLNARTVAGRTPLHTAIAEREVIEFLIARGADINAADNEGATALHLAAAQDPWQVKRLLASGANVDARDHFGRSVLHQVRDGGAGAVRTLVERGLNLNARDKGGNTPLHYAARQNDYETMRVMMRLGADTTAKNGRGETPLQLAAADVQKRIALALQGVE